MHVIGQTIAHYKVTAKLGAGGMGEVYRAHDEQLDRDVALKVLPASNFREPTAHSRLLREARSAAALNHPHICTVYEVGESGGKTYIAMELVEGQPLSKRLEAGALPAAQVLRYGSQIADALSHAHERQVAHRDLKSANVMITPEGRVKVLDFGLAKRLSEDQMNEVTRSQDSLTTPGAMVGTLAYMAPEQLQGEPVDARADIWALGMVLFEMAAGARPFQGSTGIALSSAILHESPAPLPTKVPLALRAIIERCLEKEPSRRYQRAAEARAALEVVQTGITTPGMGWKYDVVRRRGWMLAVSALVLLAVASLFAWRTRRALQNAEPLRAVPLTTLPGIVRYPSFSPDGNHMVFSWSGRMQDNPDLYVQQIDSGSPLRLTMDPGNDFNSVWSPDGRWIAFLRSQREASRSELRLIPPLGGPERRLAEITIRGGMSVTPPHLAWCPDSNCLVVTDSPGEGKPDALFVISLESGEKRQLTHPLHPTAGDTCPALSPDGRWLVFRRMAGLFIGELFLLPLGKNVTATGDPRRITQVSLDADYPAWMPDSREIVFSARGSLWKLLVSEEGTPERLPYVGEYGLMPVVSRPQPERPSRMVYVRSFEDGNIWRIETARPGVAASSTPVVAIASTRLEGMPQFSPDGRRVAFTSDRSGTWEIWLADPDGANAFQLTSIGAVAGYPHWSPDGQHIAFHSNLEGQWDIYTIPADGGKPRNLAPHPARDAFPSFSRDGKWVYFNSNRTGGQEQTIWKVPTSGGDAVQVTSFPAYAPQESPDGSYLYYVETVEKPAALWRMSVSGRVPEKVLAGVILGNFAVLAGGIYYVDRPSGEKGIHYVDLPTGETRLRYFDFATRRSITVTPNIGNVDLPLTVSPDGRKILYPLLDTAVNDLMLVERFR